MGEPLCRVVQGRLRDELLNIEEFGSLTEAKLIIEDWRIEYNTYRPHSALTDSHPPNTQTPLPTTNNQTTHKPWTTYRISFSSSSPAYSLERRMPIASQSRAVTARL
jgi:hypothetical protein